MNKDYLKQYIANYGGVEVIKDIACILQELSQEWSGTNKVLEYTFSDTALMLANAADKLDVAQTNYAKGQEDYVPDQSKYQLEFNKLMSYFQTLSVEDLKKVYSKNKDELISKLKRLEYLKKLLGTKDSDKK